MIGRTRDDRAPFVRQTQIAAWFEVRQPNVSRWERYWLAGNWPDLLSLKSGEVLTNEVRARIIRVCAAFPWWNIQQVHRHLRQQGQAITHQQVRQVFQHFRQAHHRVHLFQTGTTLRLHKRAGHAGKT